MNKFVALIRGINVGGHSKLPMKDLVSICEKLEFKSIVTYIQSGNVIFETAKSKKDILQSLETSLAKRLKKHIDVVLRSEKELKETLGSNPFKKKENAKVGIFFQNGAIKQNQKFLECPTGESVHYGKREIFIYFKNGMGRSKLQLPRSGGTVRNMNTLKKLIALLESPKQNLKRERTRVRIGAFAATKLSV